MAINDISLSAGMRSNLLGLQNTVTLLERTQQRLSSGNKVNSALDNPTSYFASQVLNSRASKIDGLKDGMGQAIQTVQAADKGIKGITALIEQAKGVAQSAQSAPASTGFSTVTISLASIALGDTLTITGSVGATASVATLTAGAMATSITNYDSTTVTFATGDLLEAGNLLVIGGVTYTACVAAAVGTTEFTIGANAAATAGNLKIAVDAYQVGAYTLTQGAGALNNQLTFTANGSSLSATTVQTSTGVVTPDELVISSVLSYTAGALTTNEFTRTGDNTVDAINLANLINNVAGASVGAFNTALTTLHAQGYTAAASNGIVTLSKLAGSTGVATTDAATNVTLTNTAPSNATRMAEALVAASGELQSLMDQYNAMRTQITALAEDSGYRGKNLLSATAESRSLTVAFENTSLTVTGFDATAGVSATTGLKVTAATWTTAPSASTAIAADLTLLDNALTTLRSQASSLSGNLSIITVRQDFSTNMINTLTEGANKLTLADTNEEGANMLMLQTRQSLGTTALSLSAQAAQSVLRLFQ